MSASPSVGSVETFKRDNLELTLVPYRTSARSRALDVFRQERQNLSRALRSAKPDLIHAHWTYEFALAALEVDKNSLITAHDAPFTILNHHRDTYRFIRLMMALRTRQQVRNLAAVSPYLATRWRREMAWKQQVSILPNIAPPAHDPSGLPSAGPRTALVIASSERRKNVETLLRAWPSVESKVSDLKLRLIGPGLGPNDRLSKSEFASGGIEFLGPLPQPVVQNELSKATMLIHPALEECHPMVVLEAMAAGIPVVGGFASGGLPWTVQYGQAGMLCDIANPGEIAEAVVRLSADELARDRLRKAGLRMARDEFGERPILNRHIAVYEEIASAHPGSRSSRKSGDVSR